MYNNVCMRVCILFVIKDTRQMLGASWDDPECIFEVNRFIGIIWYK